MVSSFFFVYVMKGLVSMFMHYFEVYDNSPYLNDRHNVMFTQTLIGRYAELEDALALAEKRTDEIGIVPRTYLPDIKDGDKTLVCVMGLFYNINDMQVDFEDSWDYGRFVSIIEIALEMNVEFPKKE